MINSWVVYITWLRWKMQQWTLVCKQVFSESCFQFSWEVGLLVILCLTFRGTTELFLTASFSTTASYVLDFQFLHSLNVFKKHWNHFLKWILFKLDEKSTGRNIGNLNYLEIWNNLEISNIFLNSLWKGEIKKHFFKKCVHFYFCLCWDFVAAHRLSLVLGTGYPLLCCPGAPWGALYSWGARALGGGHRGLVPHGMWDLPDPALASEFLTTGHQGNPRLFLNE